MKEEEFLRMAKTYGVRVGAEKTYPEYPERDFKELVLADTHVGTISYQTHFDDVKKNGRYVIIHPDPYRIRRVDDECKVDDITEEKFVAMLRRHDMFNSEKILNMMDRLAGYLDDVMAMKRKLDG